MEPKVNVSTHACMFVSAFISSMYCYVPDSTRTKEAPTTVITPPSIEMIAMTMPIVITTLVMMIGEKHVTVIVIVSIAAMLALRQAAAQAAGGFFMSSWIESACHAVSCLSCGHCGTGPVPNVTNKTHSSCPPKESVKALQQDKEIQIHERQAAESTIWPCRSYCCSFLGFGIFSCSPEVEVSKGSSQKNAQQPPRS